MKPKGLIRRFFFVFLMLLGALLVVNATLTFAQDDDDDDEGPVFVPGGGGGSGPAQDDDDDEGPVFVPGSGGSSGPAQPEIPQRGDAKRGFIGASGCTTCHRDAAESHRPSPHERALQAPAEGVILGDFSRGETARTVQFPGENTPRPFEADDIAYVVGAGRYGQAYLYEIEAGRYAVFPAEWDAVKGEWHRYELGSSWPDDPAYDWGRNCAACHTTGWSLSDTTFTWLDDGVRCEACHGGGREHRNLVIEYGRNATEDQQAEIRASIVSRQDAQICGQCHSAGLDADGIHPFPVNYFPGSGNLLAEDIFSLVAEDDPAYWWPTGHARGVNMQFNEWMRGAHGAAGIPCTTCHNPHAGSTEFLLATTPETLCTSCHTDSNPADGLQDISQQMVEGLGIVDEVPGIPSAHFTAENGPDCISCHMARVPVGHFSAASHSFQIVMPGQALPQEGLLDSCSSCHGEQASPQAMQALIDDIQASVSSRVAALKTALPTDAPAWMPLALAFVEADGSLGVHNYAYTDALLDAIENGLSSGGEN